MIGPRKLIIGDVSGQMDAAMEDLTVIGPLANMHHGSRFTPGEMTCVTDLCGAL